MGPCNLRSLVVVEILLSGALTLNSYRILYFSLLNITKTLAVLFPGLFNEIQRKAATIIVINIGTNIPTYMNKRKD